ncbi:hypothetical protein R1flu_020419 [Riccia fluitans]|uniref:ABC transporter domain-containing protein n=1 Tax=Riccia fluitans TaxID=41844 RepID=A0ABD1ZLG2_9MARC
MGLEESQVDETEVPLEDPGVSAPTNRTGSVVETVQEILTSVFNTRSIEADDALFLSRLRSRLDKAGLRLPTVEVRFENYTVTAFGFIGRRALPTICNATLNFLESCFKFLRIPIAKKKKFRILSEVSGIIKPGRMTLVLGPSGSGKTTFLLSLAGQLNPGTSLKVSGKVTYNGCELHEFQPRKTAAYVSQQDLHLGEMTVRETLLYSARSQGFGPTSEMLRDLLEKEKEMNICPDPDVQKYMEARVTPGLADHLVTEYALKILGLESCADTLIGDSMRRGISEEQKKRVTIGEMLVGPVRTFFMDDISSGLDSSMTKQIVACLRNICHSLDNTIVISLLQPSPETFSLFDDIILLSEGQVLFHGDRADVLEFFEDCGFKCPERKPVAEFLQEVTSQKDQEQYWSNKQRAYSYVTVSQFHEAFWTKSREGIRHAKELETPYDKTKNPKSFNNYAASCKEIWNINLAKEWLLMKRNFRVYGARFTAVIIVAILASTLYFRGEMRREDLQDAHLYASSIFCGIVTMFLDAYTEVILTVYRLPVFFKLRDVLFLPAWAYSVPRVVLNIPVSMIQSILWTAVTYYTIGFSSAPERFLQQWFMYFCIHLMASSLFALIAGLCRTMILSAAAGACILLFYAVSGGFLISRTSVISWWIWTNWVSPMYFAQNGLSSVEFLEPEWNKPAANSSTRLGLEYMKASGLFPGNDWFWIAVGVVMGYSFIFQMNLFAALSWLKASKCPQSFHLDDGVNGSGIARGGKFSSERSSVGRKKMSRSRSYSSNSGSKYGLISTNQTEGEDTANAALEEYKRHLAQVCSEASVDKEISSAAKEGMIMPFRPLAMSFKNINYYFSKPTEMRREGASTARLQLLEGVTGAFRPGMLSALVGANGSGKTTLMDVLAGRKTRGHIEGEIYIAGYPKKQATFARIFGYCAQNDILSPQLTVYESFIFSAWLRLPGSVKRKAKKRFVQEIMNLVELNNIKYALVGRPGVSGLTIEQRKRLTIGVELMANPSIIFMDEPTLGMDSLAAAIVMRTVRNTVDTGRTVVCAIHQPSIDVFEAFDELLFFKTGGQIIYAGPIGKRRNKQMVDEISNPSRFLFTLMSALIFGTTFWGLGRKRDAEDDIYGVIGAIYGSTLFLGIINASIVQPTVSTERTVYYRELAAGMYSPVPYGLSQVLIEIPYCLLQSVIYSIVTYPMIGLEWSIVKFCSYLYFYFFTYLNFTYYGMLAISITPNDQLAFILATFLYGFSSLFGGFLIPKPRIPGWWTWAYWICPTAYSVYGLVVSQYGDDHQLMNLNDGNPVEVVTYIEEIWGYKHGFLPVAAGATVAFGTGFASLFVVSIKSRSFRNS